MKLTKILVTALSVTLLTSVLTGCGNRVSALTSVSPTTNNATTDPLITDTTAAAQDTTVYPEQNYIDNTAANNGRQDFTAATGTPNAKLGTFKVDQSLIYDWQAKGVAVSGGTIYVSVSDTDGILTGGSVVKMDASSGKSWKDIGSKLLGLSHPISKNVQGLTATGGTVVAVDDSNIYNIDSSGNIKTTKGNGGKDVASAGGSIYIAGSWTVSRADASGSSAAPLGGLSASGGIGADTNGNLYITSGNSIKKIGGTADVSMSGADASQDIATGLTNPVDVAVDNRNGDIYVLDGTEIRRFDQNGTFIVSFSSTAKKGVAITVDENGNVYVADAGSSAKDSVIIKFGPSSDAQMASNSGYAAANNTSSYNTSSVSTYGLPVKRY